MPAVSSLGLSFLVCEMADTGGMISTNSHASSISQVTQFLHIIYAVLYELGTVIIILILQLRKEAELREVN